MLDATRCHVTDITSFEILSIKKKKEKKRKKKKVLYFCVSGNLFCL